MDKVVGEALVSLARNAINTYVRSRERIPAPKEPSQKQGVFCTIKTSLNVLRGCIGFPYPVKPLAEAVVEAAIAAATEDPRFKPVTPEELDEIKIELTILTPPKELKCEKKDIPNRVVIGKHGLIVESGYASGLLLPQVATEGGMSAVEFLESTCWKAGLPPHAWKDPSTRVFTFEGEIFGE